MYDASDKSDKEVQFQQKSKEFELNSSNLKKKLHQDLEEFYINFRKEKE